MTCSMGGYYNYHSCWWLIWGNSIIEYFSQKGPSLVNEPFCFVVTGVKLHLFTTMPSVLKSSSSKLCNSVWVGWLSKCIRPSLRAAAATQHNGLHESVTKQGVQEEALNCNCFPDRHHVCGCASVPPCNRGDDCAAFASSVSHPLPHTEIIAS